MATLFASPLLKLMQTGGSKASVEPLECREAKAGKEEAQAVCIGREWISLAIYPSSKFSLSSERVKGIRERKQHVSPMRTTKGGWVPSAKPNTQREFREMGLPGGDSVPVCPEWIWQVIRKRRPDASVLHCLCLLPQELWKENPSRQSQGGEEHLHTQNRYMGLTWWSSG